jgi:hypothetical protein
MAEKKPKKQQDAKVPKNKKVETVTTQAVDASVERPKPLGIVTNGHLINDGQPIPRLRRKVAIVGFAPSSMELVRAFFGDPEFEIWSINQLYIAFPEIVKYTTRWFQIHPRTEYDTAVRDHKHHDWLQQQKDFPIYMQKQEPDVPMSIPFPRDEIVHEFGQYFTNSISWEIALAIQEGFEQIHIYGVDMATDEEYQDQRPSCEYFIGWARGRGIKVHVPTESDLLKAFWLYPFEDDSQFRGKIEGRRKELRTRVNQLANQEQGAHDTRLQMLGALENMNYVKRAFFNTRTRWERPILLSDVKKKEDQP